MRTVGGSRWARALLGAFGALLVVWLVAPALIVIPLSLTDKPSLSFPPSGWSLEWYDQFFTDPLWYDSALNSVKIGALVAVLATALGTAAAMGLTRCGPRLRVAAGALLLSPMIVPVIVLAVGVYAVALRLGLVGTTLGIVLAHTVLALPFVVVNVYAGLLSFDRRWSLAAASLGAGPVTAFRDVTLPLILPSVLAGGVFAFISSFDEVVVSLFLQSPYLQTLPVQMYTGITQDVNPAVAAAATVMLTITTVLLVAGLVAVRRGLRRRSG